MPTRYTLYAERNEIEQHLKTSFDTNISYTPSYNIRPEQEKPVARVDHSGKTSIKKYTWGIPSATGSNSLMVDAYKADFDDEAYLNGLLKHKRCIIPANGFYEWKSLSDSNEPFYLRMLNKSLIGFAGLYDQITNSQGEKYYAFTIVTVEANAMVKPLSDTMPAILHQDSYNLWLNREVEDTDVLKEVLKPTVIYEMAALRVPDLVNNPKNDSPDLIQPIPK